MDYDYGQERNQFQDNIIAFNGEDEEDYYDETQQQQRTGGAGNGRIQYSNHDPSSSASSQGKLFVGGVSWETTKETFTNYFSSYGEVTDSVIMMERHSGKPRGFGFITFADPAVADRVLEEDHVIDGRVVEVKKTVPREDIDCRGLIRAKKIFVGGIAPHINEDDLKEYFSVYGNIVEHQIMLDHKTGRSRGFGFVTFDTEDSIEQIFSEGKNHELGGKQVEIKKAVPKRNGDYGSTMRSHAGFINSACGYGAGPSSGSMYRGKMGGGYGGYGAYGGYSGYRGYGGVYGSDNGFYGGYVGYGYGFGFGGPMMYGSGGYGGNGYGIPSGYGITAGYGGSKGYVRISDSGSGKGYGRISDSGSGKGHGSSGGHGRNKGYSSNENGESAVTVRYHPYQK